MVGGQTIPEIHIQPSTSPGPTPIPSRIRPHSTRNSSYSSTGSSRSRRPHAQQQEFVPIGDTGPVGLDERWQFEQAEGEAEELEGSSEESEEGQEAEEEPAWDNLRDGSISRRPAWRRPSPRWLFPFIIGVSLSLGTTVAPKSELYINLACLSHPPQQPRSDFASRELDFYVDNRKYDHSNDGDLSINTTIPSPGNLPVYHPTPGDQWFKKIQREIYDYEMQHRLHLNSTGPSTTARPVPTAHPSTPLPRPHDPSSPDPSPSPNPDGRPTSPGEEEPPQSDPQSRPPYHEIDPRLCKRDPKVQAATARMTMSKWRYSIPVVLPLTLLTGISVITLTSGILSALTTGFWGQVSDRVGRTKILAVTEVGFCIRLVC